LLCFVCFAIACLRGWIGMATRRIRQSGPMSKNRRSAYSHWSSHTKLLGLPSKVQIAVACGWLSPISMAAARPDGHQLKAHTHRKSL
jgi:hypothetical protein